MATTAARPKQKTKSARAADRAQKPRAAAKPVRPRAVPKPKNAAAAPSKSGKKTSAGSAALARRASPGLARRSSPTIVSLVARRALSAGTGRVSEAAQRGAHAGELALQVARQKAIEVTSTSVKVTATQRPPIQAAVDVAVPSAVAWAEWMRLEWLPDGGSRVVDVERDGDSELTGRLQGLGDGHGWRAQILDEREDESFAWLSVEGGDSAGLITFHALSERLTRIELNLDIRAVNIAQAMALASRLADRRVIADLRRFKARLELINPDLYADLTDESTKSG
jgi:uncharacterized membrane protein